MAYSGFISDPNYTRRNINEEIHGDWNFKGSVAFEKVIRGTTIAAYYGDIAENYKIDLSEIIPVGSLVKFGGGQEITKCGSNDKTFFGVISSNPAVIINDINDTENFLPVALSGRVPTRTIGIVKKFDKLTTSHIIGVAKRKTIWDTLLGKPTIGIALEEKTDKKSEKLIEIYTKSRI